MSAIKKWFHVLVVILAIAGTALISGCHSENRPSYAEPEELSQTRDEVKTSETVAAAKETAAASKVKGTIYETELFSILQPDGWKATEASGGVLFEKDGDALMVTSGDDTGFTEDYLKKLVEEAAKQQNGTPVEEVTMLGGKFFQTRGSLEGKDTTFAKGLTNGLVVMVWMIGKDHPNNVEIKAMLDSIKFK